MSKIFRITPKRTKRSNGQVLTPDMAITVTTRSHTTTPFNVTRDSPPVTLFTAIIQNQNLSLIV